MWVWGHGWGELMELAPRMVWAIWEPLGHTCPWSYPTWQAALATQMQLAKLEADLRRAHLRNSCIQLIWFPLVHVNLACCWKHWQGSLWEVIPFSWYRPSLYLLMMLILCTSNVLSPTPNPSQYHPTPLWTRLVTQSRGWACPLLEERQWSAGSDTSLILTIRAVIRRLSLCPMVGCMLSWADWGVLDTFSI